MPGRILVVDDQIFARESLGRLLTENGYDVTAVPGGREAVVAVQANSFDVAIVDVNMPEFDGFQVAAKLRQVRPDCRVIMFTGEPSVAGDTRAVDMGLYDYLPKSEWYRGLLPAISNALQGEQKERTSNEDFEARARSYKEEGRHELASLALESLARECEFAGDLDKAARVYDESAQEYSDARGVGSEGARRLRGLAEHCRLLAKM